MAFSGSILPLRSCVVASSLPSIGGGEVPDLASTGRGAVSTSKTVKREAKLPGRAIRLGYSQGLGVAQQGKQKRQEPIEVLEVELWLTDGSEGRISVTQKTFLLWEVEK